MRIAPLSIAISFALAACEPAPSSKPAPSHSAAIAPPPASSPQVAPAQPVPLLSPTSTIDPNPLGLPSRRVALDPKKRIFAPSDQMLAGAKLGSTLVLYACTALGLDGDDVIVEGRGGPSYKVHAAYVVAVPDDARARVGDAVIAEHAGVLRHGVVSKLEKDRTLVRFTDVEERSRETPLKKARIIRQLDGLLPGNYAAFRDGEVVRHVLLVSPFVDAGVKKWFALGFGGAAMKIDEAQLRTIPVKWSPKVGASVWAENVGVMRQAIVTASTDQGLFTVKFERAGRPATVGWGSVMSPTADRPPGSHAEP